MHKRGASSGTLGEDLLAQIAVRRGSAHRARRSLAPRAMSSGMLAALFGSAFVAIFGGALLIAQWFA